MDIKLLMQKMHSAISEEERKGIQSEIESMFSSLSDEQKDEVRKSFIKGMNEKIEEGEKLMERVDVYVEIKNISNYVSFNQIANEYFGKSRSWLHQRIRGYHVNGKPARFTATERKKLAGALEDISIKIHKASLKIV